MELSITKGLAIKGLVSLVATALLSSSLIGCAGVPMYTPFAPDYGKELREWNEGVKKSYEPREK